MKHENIDIVKRLEVLEARVKELERQEHAIWAILVKCFHTLSGIEPVKRPKRKEVKCVA